MNPYLVPNLTPFSYRGAYMAFGSYGNPVDGIPDLQLRTVSHQGEKSVICRLSVLVDGAPAPFAIEMEPAEMRLVSAVGTVRLCFADTETILFRAASPRLGLRFDFSMTEFIANFGYDFPFEERKLRLFICHCNRSRMLLDPLGCRMVSDQDWTGKGATHSTTDILPAPGGYLFATLRENRTEWDRIVPAWDYEETVALRRAEFRAFCAGLPAAPAGLEDARELAAYVLWSCCVRPFGALRRETMIMSKNWMTQSWSWDHAFNSIALAASDPQLAWDTFIGQFDHQDATGVLPDAISDADVAYTFCKPPIHGWALARMQKRMTLTRNQLNTAYDKLCRWTNWWLEFRDRDHNGLCEYDHGNDSGWDNSTAFAAFPPPFETPDLQAFLVLQMETLSDLARRLGRDAEAADWLVRSRTHLDRMCELCFDADGRPLSRHAFTGETVSPDTSLIYLPVLLGKRLPEHIRAYLLRELKSDRFLTEWGIATESPKSDRYQPNGYWLGPIWAPETLLFIDGVRACGDEAFAKDLTQRFLRLFQKGGSAENFDALTGEGNCDRAYTWASAVFLTLLAE